MKRILIHTLFYQNYNYGGILQAYALYHYLESKGYECIELNYKRGATKKEWFQRRVRNVGEVLRNPVVFKEKKNKIKQVQEKREQYFRLYPEDRIKKKFDEFMDTEFRQTRLYHSSSIRRMKESYDICITGGDQMWNPLWHDENFYLAFSNKKNIAYSCSVAKDILTVKDENLILSNITHLDAVSVRESVLFKWLTDKKVKAELVCDPVFLRSKEEWGEFAVQEDFLPDEYIFAYLLGDGLESRKQIRKLADKLQIKIVAIPHVKRMFNKNDENFADYNLVNIGPREFVGLIKNAKYVITDSFHGTAFSIIMQKNFISISRFAKNDAESLNSRILSVLELYGLQNRMFSLEELPRIEEDFLEEINWKVVEKIVKKEQKTGMDYLENSLKERGI